MEFKSLGYLFNDDHGKFALSDEVKAEYKRRHGKDVYDDDHRQSISPDVVAIVKEFGWKRSSGPGARLNIAYIHPCLLNRYVVFDTNGLHEFFAYEFSNDDKIKHIQELLKEPSADPAETVANIRRVFDYKRDDRITYEWPAFHQRGHAE